MGTRGDEWEVEETLGANRRGEMGVEYALCLEGSWTSRDNPTS